MTGLVRLVVRPSRVFATTLLSLVVLERDSRRLPACLDLLRKQASQDEMFGVLEFLEKMYQ